VTSAYRGAIFDLFGTLVPEFSRREHERIVAAMAEALGMGAAELHSELGRTWPQRVVGEFASIEDNLRCIVESTGRAVGTEVLSEAARIRLSFTEHALEPKPDALEVLSRLHQAGLRIGLISDCSADVPQVWPRSVLSRHIDAPVFSCSVHLVKPNPRIYLHALRALALQPSQCVYVGDGNSQELTGARNVGMYAVLVVGPNTDSYEPEREEVRGWAGPRISDLTALLPLVGLARPRP